ncbi:MAG: ATP synthase F1 subunit delta [Clostridia bacterium]|nr:ATP synthase F1 subunit delta [Clostridia bacterium]
MGKEYGEALYELARDEHVLEELHGELTEIGALIKAEPDFIKLLSSRAIERDTRVKVVDDTFGGRAHVFIVNFMKLLVEKERVDCLEDCVKWFHQRYNDDLGIVEAYVTSAVELTENDREALRQKLEQMSGRKVALIASVDKALIGGVRVEMDGRRYDNTIQNKLGRLRQRMAQGL